jgi:hypothetical protein
MHPTNRPKAVYYTQTYITREVPFKNTSVPVTTLCDGQPRALAQTSTRITVTTLNRTTVLSRNPEPTGMPECGVDPKGCAIINTIYKSRVVSWQSALASLNGPIDGWAKLGMIGVVANHKPYFCSTVSACPTSSCSIGIDFGTMFYWPVTIVGGDICDKKGRTITPTPTIPGVPNTAEFRGQTLVSPSAYLLARPVSAFFRGSYEKGAPRAEEGDCGNKYRSAWVSVAPESLSSFRKTQREDGFGWTYPFSLGPPYSFDLNDLNTVRWDVYSSAVLCAKKDMREKTCRLTAEPDKYTPILSLPIALKTAGFGVPGEWENCVPETPVGDITYVPITGTTVEVPLRTNYGSVDDGGKLTSVTPTIVPEYRDFWPFARETTTPTAR